MASRGWMRSNAEGGNQVQGEREEKGKGIMEDAIEKEILSVHDDSEDDVEMFDSDGEKGGPGSERLGRTGKIGRAKVQEIGKEDVRGNQEHEEGEEFGNLVGGRRRRGRGGYRRRGGAGGRRG